MTVNKQDDGAPPSGRALVNDAPSGHRPSGFDPSRDPTPAPFWLIMTEQNYAIRFSFDNGNYAMDFRVFAAAEGWHTGDTVGSWGLFDGNNDFAFEDWGNAFCEIDGAVKWDGCINWQTNPECMMHGCGPRHISTISAIFETVYAAGSAYYDYLGDEPPPMPKGVISILEAARTPRRLP